MAQSPSQYRAEIRGLNDTVHQLNERLAGRNNDLIRVVQERNKALEEVNICRNEIARMRDQVASSGCGAEISKLTLEDQKQAEEVKQATVDLLGFEIGRLGKVVYSLNKLSQSFDHEQRSIGSFLGAMEGDVELTKSILSNIVECYKGGSGKASEFKDGPIMAGIKDGSIDKDRIAEQFDEAFGK